MVLQAIVGSTRSGLTFGVERWEQFVDEARALFVLHWDEVAQDKHLLRLDVDERYYRECERIGKIIYVTARFQGRLVGYVWWLVYMNPHYRTVKCATADIHFLRPEYRTGLNGYLLLKSAIKVVRDVGVTRWHIREKIGHEHPAMLRRLGMKPVDVLWAGGG